MQYLCFVNGRNQDEIVKIFEGESYEIDKFTCGFIDSTQVRERYSKQFEEFQAKYPQAKRGSVRIFGDNVYSENGQRVLYKKHKVAFNHIIKDASFLRWFSRKELKKEPKSRIVFDLYILRGMAEFHKETIRIKQFLTTLKQKDRKEFGVTGGAKRYYRFMRSLLACYEEYCQKYDKPSIDCIWEEHLRVLQTSKLEKNHLGSKVIIEAEEIETLDEPLYSANQQDDDIDPDRIYYDEEPIIEEPLYDFFTSDLFERYCSNTFVDCNLMIVGDLSLTGEQKKLQPWIDVSKNCYNGSVSVTDAHHLQLSNIEAFNNSSIIIIYGEIDTQQMRTLLIRAVQNKAEIVLISENPTLLEMYAKKFKNIIPILDSEYDKHISAKRQLVDFFIGQYSAKKGYQKS